MTKVLFSYFKSYSGRLAKLQYDESTTIEDLMGVDDTQVGHVVHKNNFNRLMESGDYIHYKFCICELCETCKVVISFLSYN